MISNMLKTPVSECSGVQCSGLNCTPLHLHYNSHKFIYLLAKCAKA